MLDSVLSKQQIEVISALSNGVNMTAAAEQAGVHRNTIAYWRRNSPPFQHALSHAQYDRAMLHREKTEDLVDLAFKTIQEILADPKASPSVRLKAALAIIQAASTPPEPKRQVTLDIEKVQVIKHDEPTILTERHGQFVHKNAQSTPPPAPQKVHEEHKPSAPKPKSPRQKPAVTSPALAIAV